MRKVFAAALGLAWLAIPAGAVRAAETRDGAAFQRWLELGDHRQRVAEFDKTLQEAGVARLFPQHLLLRTASDWDTPACRKVDAPPFDIPPAAAIIPTLRLLKELKDRQLLPGGDPVSVYRRPAVNACADGAGRSAHLSGNAVDFAPSASDPERIAALCNFWRTEGRKFNMGLSVYADSGRIHIDTLRYRTWASKSPKGQPPRKPVCSR